MISVILNDDARHIAVPAQQRGRRVSHLVGADGHAADLIHPQHLFTPLLRFLPSNLLFLLYNFNEDHWLDDLLLDFLLNMLKQDHFLHNSRFIISHLLVGFARK